MKALSVGAILASRIAVMGVRAAMHQYLEKEHLLIGLCSLEKGYMLAEEFALSAEDWQTVLSEHEQIEKVLGTFKISTIQLRRQLREKLVNGTYEHTGVVHRSKACKQVYAYAGELAASADHVSCLHLLAALLEDPGKIISIAFQEIGVVPKSVQQHILSIISPQPKESKLPIDLLRELLQSQESPPSKLVSSQESPPPKPEPFEQRIEKQHTSTTSVFRQAMQDIDEQTLENIAAKLAILKRFTEWEALREDVLASPQKDGLLRTIRLSANPEQRQAAVVALHVLSNLKEGITDGEAGYNARRLLRILEVLRTRGKAIFSFLELLKAPQHKAVVFRALLDLSDPTEHEYKNLIQRFLGLESEINEHDTLGNVLLTAPKALQGIGRIMKALHEINFAVATELRELLEFRKGILDALLDALDMAEIREITQRLGRDLTFPLYIGLAIYATAATTQGEITVGMFLRQYMCKEVPLFVLLGMLNKNVFAGAYMRSNLVRPEVVGFPMDLAGSELAIREILKAFDETLAKSQVTLDNDKNIVLQGEPIENIPGTIRIDPHGNITVDCPVTIRQVGEKRRITLAPQDGPYKVVQGKVIETKSLQEVPGPPCNIIEGAEIFQPHIPGGKMVYSSLLHLMTPKGVVYGSPEPTEKELKAVDELIDKRKEAEPKKAQILEGDRPKPLRFKQLLLLYITKCAIEQFYVKYMENPQAFYDKLLTKSGISTEFQAQIDQEIQELLTLVFRISSELSGDKSGGWKNFWELFTKTIPEQLCKYVEMTTEFMKITVFMLPVLGVQRELGEVYWNVARLMILKGGYRIPPIPQATAPSGQYKKILKNIQKELQSDSSDAS